MVVENADLLLALIYKCRSEPYLEERIKKLKELNAGLPTRKRLEIPSLITPDYVNRALDILDDVLSSTAETT
ncbi:MAG: hypothetical protein ABI361_06270 [Nitrososphaera sp.]|jgi:hypothetical protein